METTLEHLYNLINLDYFIRIAVAVIFGFSIGLERELTNKYAGLRTHILVCLGACVFTLISIYGFPTFAPGDNVLIDQATGIRDTSRVAAQIVTGIGFIGAGTVLRNGPIVLGLTTAATLWIAASIGMACGAGMFDIAFAGTLLSILTLVSIRVFERKVLPSSTKKITRVKVAVVCQNEFADKIQDYIIDTYKNISQLSRKTITADNSNTKITCIIHVSYPHLKIKTTIRV
ncbi:MAG: MgtC/SapB family protein [Candidatus Gastranaerophilales bacterium]|nr:MgtC/SapB family protein [Candidatus Gastranaerophilales bacterium]